MSRGITADEAVLAHALKCKVGYLSKRQRCGPQMDHGLITEPGKKRSTVQAFNRDRPEEVSNQALYLSSYERQRIAQEMERRLNSVKTDGLSPVESHARKPSTTKEAAMPPEVAPRPIKAEPIHMPPATPPPEPGQGAFMAIAARMDLAARRVEEREQAAKQAGKDLLAAQQLHDEALAAVKEAKSDLERLGTEFSQRYTGLVGARP